MTEITTRHYHVQINGSLVHLIQYGSGQSIVGSQQVGNVSDIKTGDTSKEKLVLFVPGNPGILGLYHDFLCSLYANINTSLTSETKLLAMSHNNMSDPESAGYRTSERIVIDEKSLNFAEKSTAKKFINEPDHIEMQVLNKIVIISRILKINLENCKLVFVGHSIGCYVILRLLQERDIASAHSGSMLIHPALENLALTSKGRRFAGYFNYRLDYIVRLLALVLENVLPHGAKLRLTKSICSSEFVEKSSETVIESLMQLMSRTPLNSLIEMAKSEFRCIKDIDSDLMIRPHVPKLKLIYAIDDHWVNANHRATLKKRYPGLYIEENERLHAFIMDPKTVTEYSTKVGLIIEELTR